MPRTINSETPRARLSLKEIEVRRKSQNNAATTITEQVDSNQLPQIQPDPENRYNPFPLNEIQQAYFVGRQAHMELGNISTHGYSEIDCNDLDLDQFGQAWRRVIDHHEMLRGVIDHNAMQRVLKDVPPYNICIKDLRDFSSEEIDQHLRKTREELSHQVFELGVWPMFELRASILPEGLIRLHFSIDIMIMDDWSIRLIFQQLHALYVQPETTILKSAISFRDYVFAVTRLMELPIYLEAEHYWNERVVTLPPSPGFPLIRKPKEILHPQFSSRTWHLNKEDWQILQRQATRVGLTLTGAIMAAFTEVLAYWSKSPNFTLNVTLFNRLSLHPDVNKVVGNFSSLALVEIDKLKGVSFRDRAKELQKQLWTDLDHQMYSGVSVLRQIAKKQGRFTDAIMPVVFTSSLMSDQVDSVSNVKSVFGKIVYNTSQTPQVYLDHQLFEDSGSLVINWDSIDALFPDDMLDQMFESYCRLLRRLVDDTDAWELPYFDLIPLSQKDIRTHVNDTAGPISTSLLHHGFVKHATNHREYIAVITGHTTWSYGEIYDRALGLAHQLQNLGAQPNLLIAVVMEKGVEQIVAVLGILLAGAAYLPLNVRWPKQRLEMLLSSSNCSIVLTQSNMSCCMSLNGSYNFIEVDKVRPADSHISPPKPVQSFLDIAYVIYTSGSTGIPKGVSIDHRGALNTVLDINERFNVGEQDRVLALSELNFDLSVYDIFGTLSAGAAIVIPAASDEPDPVAWALLAKDHKVTVWNSVPALLEMYVEYVSLNPEDRDKHLRLALVSGDWIPLSLPDRLRALSPKAKFISLGGATEVSIWSIYYPVESISPEWPSIPYGQPLRNQTFHVLDQHLNTCPDYVTGELYIGGIGLAKGYWGNKERTDQSFIVHHETGERLYRTGDIGCYMPDGNIQFQGRMDNQVKILGHRIELGEIESTFEKCPIVDRVVVIADGDKGKPRRLIAYVVPKRSGYLNVPGERNHHLPSKLVSRKGSFTDPVERLHFKLSWPGIRRDLKASTYALDAKMRLSVVDDEKFYIRRSYRDLDSCPITLDHLNHLLGELICINIPATGLPKAKYASAGGLYPVQVYLIVNPGGVSDFPAGAYYYDPEAHELQILCEDEHLPASICRSESQNGTAFAIYLVADLSAIRPMYEDDSIRFATLEAGLMTQLLEEAAPHHGIGLCQIGRMDNESLVTVLRLGPDHIPLNCLMGGAIESVRIGQGGFRVEMSEITQIIEEMAKDIMIKEEIDIKEIETKLRHFLKERLPDYMLPSYIMFLENLPLSPNGKVDRGKLPRVNISDTKQKEYLPAEEGVEKRIALIICQVLDIDKVGRHDNFFEIGGNSINLVQVHGQLEAAFGQKFSIVELFRNPTLSTLAAYVVEGNLQKSQYEPGRDSAVDAGRQRLSQRRMQSTINDKPS